MAKEQDSSSSKNSFTPILVILLIIAAYLLGVQTTKIQYLEKGKTVVAGIDTVNENNKEEVKENKIVDIGTGNLQIMGNKDAKVTVVEFSDFQCPFCRRFYKDTFSQIKKEYVDTGKVKFAFRHFPLNFHPGARPAALASECANEQEKFWEMHDKIFEEQEKSGDGTVEYTTDDLKTWAQNIGLDQNKFNNCLDSEKYAQNVDNDLKDGQAAGVNGTPATFVNGQIVIGAQPFSAFKVIIDQELSKSE